MPVRRRVSGQDAAAALLGLSGEVDADEMAVLYGRFVVPSTAGGTRLPSGRWEPEQVLGRAVSTRVRADGSVLEPMAALDVTFSPSKSVSLLSALSSDPQVRDSVVDAHEAAVATALEYLDAHASHTRTGAGGVRRVESGGLRDCAVSASHGAVDGAGGAGGGSAAALALRDLESRSRRRWGVADAGLSCDPSPRPCCRCDLRG